LQFQLLQGQINNFKRAKPFVDWLTDYRPNPDDRALYLQQNDIPPESECSLAFREFEAFYRARMMRLHEKLKVLLCVEVDKLGVSRE